MDRPGLLQYTAEYTFSQLKCKPVQTSNLKKLLIFLENDEKKHFVDEFEYLAVLDLRPKLARLLFPCFLRKENFEWNQVYLKCTNFKFKLAFKHIKCARVVYCNTDWKVKFYPEGKSRYVEQMLECSG